MEINPIMPKNFNEELRTYLEYARQKKDELDRRHYFSSKVLVGWFGIKPEHIDYDKERRDLYYAGILFETKAELNETKRKEAFKELKNYINTTKSPIIKIVVTDLIRFEIYNIEDIKNYTDDIYSNIKPIETFDLNHGNAEEVFNKLYRLLYVDQLSLPINNKIIVPRLLNLINKLSLQLEIKSDDIKFLAWKKYLSIALGSEKEASIDLFKKYVILYYISIFSVAKMFKIKANRADIVSGNAFIVKGILNFISHEDFFNVLDYKSNILDEIENELNLYNFEQQDIEKDFFRLLYEELILPSNRHSLGEFYTPEWLAQYIVDELVKKENIVLDPACGSGTFLKLAIKKKKMLGSKNIESQIVGFDINPIAVIISKANILLEFRKVIPIIPVFVADSLMPELSVKQAQLGPEYVNINFGEIVKGEGTERFYYKPFGKDLSPNEMYEYIKKMEKAANGEIEINGDLLINKALIEAIRKLINNGKDHIWFFILQNIYNPYYYKRKVDVVIGNPPWLTYKDVESPTRQQFLDKLYIEYNLGSGSRNKTNQDMAAFFIARCQEYLKNKDDGKIGFVLTRAILDSSQYGSIRKAVISNNKLPKISKIYDISPKLNPFNRSSCIVIFDFRNNSTEIDGAVLDSDKKVKVDETPRIILDKKKFYINITINESGIGTSKLNKQIGTTYKEEFKQGATIIPRSYYFVEINEKAKYGFKVSCAPEYKNAVGKRSKKKDWLNFPDNKVVERHLIYDVIVGESLGKYYYSTKKVVLPLLGGSFIFKELREGNHYKIVLADDIDSKIQKIAKNASEQDIIKNLFIDLSKIYQDLENDWEEKRQNKFDLDGKPSQRMGILERLNYNNELIKQMAIKGRYIVVYNTSGKDIRCCVVDKSDIIIDSECYYYKTNNRLEAHYLEGVLNSKALLNKFKDSGLKSERHIHKKIFELGIPRFSKSNNKHVRIAELAEKIEMLTKRKENLDEIERCLNKIEKLVDEII
jgi:type I restriction-modification system DNA methylase subunit